MASCAPESQGEGVTEGSRRDAGQLLEFLFQLLEECKALCRLSIFSLPKRDRRGDDVLRIHPQRLDLEVAKSPQEQQSTCDQNERQPNLSSHQSFSQVASPCAGYSHSHQSFRTWLLQRGQSAKHNSWQRSTTEARRLGP